MSTNLQQTDELIANELKSLLLECGTNKRDHAIIGIIECINAGVVTRRAIVDTLSLAGLNPKHVHIVLKGGTGSDPARHRWQRDEAGVYRNLN